MQEHSEKASLQQPWSAGPQQARGCRRPLHLLYRDLCPSQGLGGAQDYTGLLNASEGYDCCRCPHCTLCFSLHVKVT